MRFLAYDGMLAKGIRWIFHMFLLNICYVLCCIPCVTIGAATTALYSVYINKTDESSPILRFFRAFGSNFRQATWIWIILFPVGAALGGSLYLTFVVDYPFHIFFRIVLFLLSAIYLSILAFVFPIQAHYENRIRQTLRNAFILGLSGIPYGLAVAGITCLPLLVFFFLIDWLPYLMSVWILVGAPLAAQINISILNIVFRYVHASSGNVLKESEEKGN